MRLPQNIWHLPKSLLKPENAIKQYALLVMFIDIFMKG